MAEATRRDVVLIAALILAACIAVTAASDESGMGWITAGRPACRGTIGECLGGEEEMELGTEVARRILATSKYISYDALRRDSVPCSRRGQSYYNCKPGAQENPYSRGCSAITRCRS